MSWGRPAPRFPTPFPLSPGRPRSSVTTPARPSAPPCQGAGQPGVLLCSESFPPQHLGMEDAEYRPGLGRELR